MNIGVNIMISIEERITKLEDIVNDILSSLPCTHKFPIEEDYVFDGESENKVYICSKCGDQV